MGNRGSTHALLMGIMSLSPSVLAENGDMTFHGVLVEPPPCSINEGQRIEVNFGERVGINKIDGVYNRQKLDYWLTTCENANSGKWALTLSLEGNRVDFDKDALKTNQENLGIRVYQNDMPFTPGSVLNIDLANPPRLEAVLVKRADSELTEGSFEAWATLRADYQ